MAVAYGMILAGGVGDDSAGWRNAYAQTNTELLINIVYDTDAIRQHLGLGSGQGISQGTNAGKLNGIAVDTDAIRQHLGLGSGQGISQGTNAGKLNGIAADTDAIRQHLGLGSGQGISQGTNAGKLNGIAADTYVIRQYILASSAADVYGTSATITLDSLPDVVYVGEQVIFTGTLTSGGAPLSGSTVTIREDDPLVPDEYLAEGVTDQSGRYFILWTAEAAIREVDFDIYAEFRPTIEWASGDTYMNFDAYFSQTPRQTMSVIKYGGSLILDDVPARAAYGDVVTFSGTLRLDGHNPEGSIVYIQDEDLLNPDDLLVSAYVDGEGRFETAWIVEDVDPDSTIDIQAVYESNSMYYRMASPIQHLRAYHGPPAPPQPDPSPAGGDGYMELYHALDFGQSPRIAIVPAPASYDSVRKHIVPVQEGILQLTAMLEREYGAGDWSVEFDVIEPGGRAAVKPDIILNLVTSDEDDGCGVDYAGFAQVRPMVDPMPTTVCSLDHTTDAQIGSTAAHEFVHAIGVGHTFNIPGDMMCSVEDDYGETCPGVYNKSTIPSVLNLAALVAIYGTDGFQNPNNDIIYKTRLATDGSITSPSVDETDGINTADRLGQYDDVYWPEDCYLYEGMNSCLDYYCASYWDIDGFLSYYICLEDPFSYHNP